MTRILLIIDCFIKPVLILSLLIPMVYSKPASAAEINGEFQVMCSINHQAADDPIVFPGQPGKAHMHSFYGNKTTDAHSTAESLMASTSSCGRNMESSDRSAYWIPSLVVKNSDGTKSVVTNDKSFIFIYYQREGNAKVQPFPIGLRMITGDAKATGPQSDSIFYWACGGGGGGPHYATIPTCNEPGQPIHATINFPNCWNGKQLDSPDHKSHMAFASANGTCPSTHPVAVPKIVFNVDYPGIKGGSKYELASGPSYTMHADFFAAWDSRVQNALVSECLNTPRPCIGIHREGDIIFKPDYDPDPIPDIDLRKFQASPDSGLDQSPAAVPGDNTNTHSGHVQGTQDTSNQQNDQSGLHDQHESNENTPAAIPSTGAAVALGGFGLGTLGFMTYLYRSSRKSIIENILNK